ncbi:MAG: Ig-like domain repeat protein [Methanosphaera sp.]|nr:Ig-like domain repeat protein [Methanosphaera sp.]
MLNKKISFFIIIVMLLIFGLSIVTAGDNSEYNTLDSADCINAASAEGNTDSFQSMEKSYDEKKQSSEYTAQSDTSAGNIQKRDKDIKTSKRIVITNQTFNTYFTDKYLNDRVSNGDVLDFQGNFIGDEYSMYINKAVNVTSSTGDAYIYLNTSANDWFGGDDVAAFTITKSGAYTNVSHIYFYNSQIFVKNSHHIIFNNISAIVESSTVGRGVGQTSIRENSSFVTVENSTFSTKDQWGGCVLVLAWANNCTVRYNTLIGIGEVGNLFYLTTFNVEGDLPRDENGNYDYNMINVNNTFENNMLIGPGYAQGMCYVICLSGTNNRIVNNTVLNYNGYGINVQAYSFDYDMRTLIANNTLIGSNFFMPNGSTVINNTCTGNFSMGTRSIVENNTFSNIKLIYDNLTLANTNVENVLISTERSNITIENCNITGNLTLKGSSIAELPTNVTIRNNYIGENLILNGSKNLTVTNNTIAKQIIFSSKNSMNNNVTISNNTIITDEEYTILVNKKVRGLNISDNYLLTDTAVGNDTIYFNAEYEDYIIKNDMKQFRLNNSNYNRFFDEDGNLRSHIPTDDVALLLTGNMNNRKFTFTNGSVNFTNPMGYNLTGCSVEVKADANVSLNKIKVDRITYELTSSNYNRYFNSNGTFKIDTVNNNVTLRVAGAITNKSFVFVNGSVNFTNPNGYNLTSSSVYVKANSRVSLNNIKVDTVTYELTGSNYARFFNNDGTIKEDILDNNITFVLAGNMNNRKFVFTNGSVNFSNPKEYNLTGCSIEVKANSKVSLNKIKVDRITYELTNSNYNRYFNADCTFKVDTVNNNVTLLVAGAITNKSFVFVNGNVNFTNPNGYNLTGCSVEVKADANVSLNKIKVDRITYELTNSNYNRYFNSNGTFKIDSVNNNVTLVIAGNMNNRKFVFANGTLNFSNPNGYNLTGCSVEVKANSKVSLNNIHPDRITYELTDSNYNRLFNNDGTLKIDTINDNVTIAVSGNINNRKFVFTNATVNFTNPNSYTITASTVEVKANADVILNKIKVDRIIYELTDSNYEKFFNDDGEFKLDAVNNNITLLVAGNMHDKNFIFTNGTLNFTNPKNYTFTNSTVTVRSNADVLLNKINVDMITYELTDSNYVKFFNDDGTQKDDIIKDNVTLLVAGDIHNKDFKFDEATIIFTNKGDYTLYNATIEVTSKAQLFINGLIIRNEYTNVDNVILLDSKNNMINDTRIDVYTNTQTHAIRVFDDNNTISDVNVTVQAGSYQAGSLAAYAVTIEAKDVSDNVVNTKIANTKIDVNGSDNAYGLNVAKATDLTVSNLTININSNNASYPVYITDSNNMTISGQITSNATNNAYAAYVSQTGMDKTTNITFSNFDADVTSDSIKAITLDGVRDVTIENSRYVLEGRNITALDAVMGGDSKNILVNNITVQIHTTDNSTLVSLDNVTNANITNSQFKSNIGEGIMINDSRDILVDSNYVNVTSDYTVEVNDSVNTNVTNNGLYALNEEGDASVRVSDSTASVHDNNILNSIVRISGNLTVYKPSDITVTVTDLNGNPIRYGSVSLIVNGEDNEVLFTGASATFAYTPQTMDDVDVTAVYTSPNQLQITNSTTLEVSMMDTSMTLTSMTALVNQTVTVTATVNDVLGNAVRDGLVTFAGCDGTSLGTYDASGGQVSVNVSYPEVGVYNITATYSNSSKYKASTANATVTVNMVNMDIKGTLTVFTPAAITVKLTNQNGNPVIEGSVAVYVNGKNQSVTFKGGVAMLNYTPRDINDVNVTAIYTTTDDFSVNKSTTLKVAQIDTSMTLTSKTALVNQVVTVTATLRDALGAKVKDGVVSFTDSSGKSWGSVGVVNGEASVDVSYSKVGVYNLTAVYSNSRIYKNSTAKTNVTVGKVNIAVSGNLTVFTSGKITVKLTNQNNSAVTAGSLEVEVNGKKQNVTFANGVAVLNYTPLSMDNVNVTALYTTTDNFPVNKTSSLKVAMIATKTSLTSRVVLVNQNIRVTANVKDALGANVKDGMVSFTDSTGKSWGSVRVVNGEASVDVSYSKVGVYNLTAVYSNSRIYKNSTAKTNVTVNKVNIAVSGNLTVFTPSSITIKLTNQNNSPVTAGGLEVKVNGKKQNVTFKNGAATLKYTPENTTKVNISATYTTADNFTVNRTQTLNVNKIATTLKVTSNKKAPMVNEKVELTFTLMDKMKNPLTNQRIIASVNDRNYTVVTDNKGTATLEYSLNKNSKNLTLTANYNGNTSYLAIGTNLTLNRTYKLDMELLTGSFNTKPGDTVKLVAHLRDNGVDIEGGQLVFKLNGLSLKDENDKAVVVTIRNGLAILEYKIPDTLSAKVHKLTAVYASTLYGRVELDTPMTIAKYTTHIDVNPIYTTGNNTGVKAQVVDQNNHALNKETKICIKINGKSYTFNTPNGTIDYTINQTFKDGYYNITIISGENGKYMASTVKTLLVKSKTPVVTNYINNTLNTKTVLKSGDIKTGSVMSILTGSSTVKVGDRLKLVAHLSEDVVDITGGQLVFKINGMSLKDENDSAVIVSIKDGLGILDYKIPDTLGARTHNLTAVYVSKKYGRINLTTALTTNKLNTHIDAEPIFTKTSTAYIKAQILDDNNQLINRQTTVVIKVDGKSYTINNTNGKINFKVPFNLTQGLHQVTIITGENGKYLSSRANTVLIRT